MAITLKNIGSTLNSIGNATVKPLINKAENIVMAPFNTIETISNNMTNNPMFYIAMAGVAIFLISKK